jgi:hypothetical protein
MGTSQPQQTTQTPQAAEATPRSGGPAIVPTPQPNELSSFLAAMTNATLRGTPSEPTWRLKADGSAVDQQSFDVNQGSPTWP